MFGTVLEHKKRNVTFEDTVNSTSRHLRQPWMYSIQKLVPFLDSNGILRVGGRLNYNDDFANEKKHPAFLPKNHQITKLFILDKHERLAHHAARSVLAQA